MKQRQKGGVVKYRSVRYIFYVGVKFINLRFIIRIKLVPLGGSHSFVPLGDLLEMRPFYFSENP